MPPRPLDPLKAILAESVQANLLPLAVIEKAKLELDVTDVEIQNLSPTETIIRVRTKTGIRYFHNKLREMM